MAQSRRFTLSLPEDQRNSREAANEQPAITANTIWRSEDFCGWKRCGWLLSQYVISE